MIVIIFYVTAVPRTSQISCLNPAFQTHSNTTDQNQIKSSQQLTSQEYLAHNRLNMPTTRKNNVMP